MFFTKMLIFILLCLFIQENNSKGLFHGFRTYQDVLLHNETYVKEPIWLSLRYDDVVYPEYYEENNYTITVVDIKDNLNIEDGGFAEVDYGGYGYEYVNVHLSSQRGKGYNFTIEIYGVNFL